MRLRNIPGSREEIYQYPYVIPDPSEFCGCWDEMLSEKVFSDKSLSDHTLPSHPISVEIGMGKGRFLREMADTRPDTWFIGIEMYSSVLLRAIYRRERLRKDIAGDPFPNLFYLRMDAGNLPEVFSAGEVSRIFINFPDPWPKARHAHRRLTSRQFLARYEKILAPGAAVEFKTDNQELFTFSLEEAEAAGWTILASTRDLAHDSTLLEGNIMTEYEEKFSSQGMSICKMILKPSSPLSLASMA